MPAAVHRLGVRLTACLGGAATATPPPPPLPVSIPAGAGASRSGGA